MIQFRLQKKPNALFLGHFGIGQAARKKTRFMLVTESLPLRGARRKKEKRRRKRGFCFAKFQTRRKRFTSPVLQLEVDVEFASQVWLKKRRTSISLTMSCEIRAALLNRNPSFSSFSLLPSQICAAESSQSSSTSFLNFRCSSSSERKPEELYSNKK